ncbi:S9 family peptidase [bacterium]|nr:S9 family peptidase [bacterium]
MNNAHARGLYRILAFALLATLAALTPVLAQGLDYPEARRGDVVDDYHGTQVADPYRWMEELGSDELKQWVDAENELTFSYLDGIAGRDAVYERMMQRVDYERFSAPAEAGGRYFFTRNDGLQNQSVLYVSEGLDGEARVILDPNAFSDDSSVSLASWQPSDDGTLLLYAKSVSGSDWCEWQVRDVATGEDLPDLVQWGKFGVASWGSGNAGFYYLTFPVPAEGEEFTAANVDRKTMYHAIGTEQSADELVYELPEHPDWWISAGTNEQRDLLVIYLSERGSTGNRIYLMDPADPQRTVEKLIDIDDADFGFLGNNGDRLWFQTTLDAPRGRIVEIDRRNPDRANWQELVPESRFPLSGVSLTGGRMLCEYLQDARSAVKVYDMDGSFVQDLQLPGVGSAGGLGGRMDASEVFYTYTDMTTPGTIYRLNLATLQSELYRQPELSFDPSSYVGEFRFYRSKDGTAVPLFLAHHKDIELDGSNPTVLYGYGGFNSSQGPYFSTSRTVWMDMGGVWAIACIRGGGEYGEAWHQAAIKTNRQVAFDDFIAAAEFLIDSGYTSRGKLAVMGGSNGGLLVGAVMTQRPELFAAALPQVGVMDMLRFNQFTAGGGWESDFGSPQDPEEFKALYAYSPLHNLREGVCYPPTLATTADTDDRVVPSHTFKFTAQIQHVQACDNPVLVRVETQAGHGAGKPLAKSIAEFSDLMCFALHNMGVDIPAALDRFE